MLIAYWMPITLWSVEKTYVRQQARTGAVTGLCGRDGFTGSEALCQPVFGTLMARAARSSPGDTSVRAVPVASARPVRPARCT